MQMDCVEAFKGKLKAFIPLYKIRLILNLLDFKNPKKPKDYYIYYCRFLLMTYYIALVIHKCVS